MTENTTRRARRLLLHACCGPCLLEPLDLLSRETDSITVLFANPNIHPRSEYVHRRDTLLAYAQSYGTPVVELPYDREAWNTHVGVLASAGASRCRACYRLRLTMASAYAAEHGFDAVATTLTVSPHQHHDAIHEEGERAAHAAGVTWIRRDFRERYRDSVVRSNSLGMYRQNYCGCVFSEQEAVARRAEHKARRAQERAARQAERES